jgi:hypothetical protein
MVSFGRNIIVLAIAAAIAVVALSCQSVHDPVEETDSVEKPSNSGLMLGDDDDLAGGFHRPQPSSGDDDDLAGGLHRQDNAVSQGGWIVITAEGQGCAVLDYTCTQGKVRIWVWECDQSGCYDERSYCVNVIDGVAEIWHVFAGDPTLVQVRVDGFAGGPLYESTTISHPNGNTIYLSRDCTGSGHQDPFHKQ